MAFTYCILKVDLFSLREVFQIQKTPFAFTSLKGNTIAVTLLKAGADVVSQCNLAAVNQNYRRRAKLHGKMDGDEA